MATSHVRAALGVVLQSKKKTFSDPAPGEARRVGDVEISPGDWDGDFYGLPPECPVAPLGMEGTTLHVMDSLGQLISIEPSALGAGMIQMLFGERQDYLPWAWPRFRERKKSKGGEPEVAGWAPELVKKTLYSAAAKRGLFSPRDRVRGRGAWVDKHGGLIWHSGEALWRPDQIRKHRHGVEYVPLDTGDVGEFFYPRRPDVLRPWPEEIDETRDNPAVDILSTLMMWHWARPEVDPVLFLGWLCASLLGGALEWRPSIFVTGDAACGKSTLQAFTKAILGPALLQSVDTTAAGVRQTVQQDSLPIAVDELEAEADNRKASEIIKLAKLAASGGEIFRGGADHQAQQFKAQSCFLFTAINPPAMEPAEASRMGILSLKKLKTSQRPVIDGETLGPRLLRRMMDRWRDLKPTMQAYADVMLAHGHDGRSFATLGTLLACADLALGEYGAALHELPMKPDQRKAWGELIPAPERTPNWLGCLRHLLTARVDCWRLGTRTTIGKALEDLIANEGIDGLDRNPISDEDNIFDYRLAKARLGEAGVGLEKPGWQGADPADGFLLAIPNESSKVASLYRETKWVGAPGASVWKGALRQGPPELFLQGDNRVRIDGVQTRCLIVKIGVYWRGEW
jgi:hypothetical protein